MHGASGWVNWRVIFRSRSISQSFSIEINQSTNASVSKGSEFSAKKNAAIYRGWNIVCIYVYMEIISEAMCKDPYWPTTA